MMMRKLFVGLLLATFSAARAETLVTEAKIAQISERGFIFTIGTEPLAVEDGSQTKFWARKEACKRDAFKVGDSVLVRIKTDADPPIIRELADVATGKWLQGIRSSYQRAVIDKVDSKYLHVKFEDGSKFSYRATEKSNLKLKDKPEGALSDLQPGMTVFVKGRLLPTLDTFAWEVTDITPTAPTSGPKPKKAPAKEKAKKLDPIPASGVIEGVFYSLFPELKMFDGIFEGRALHISYNLRTKFLLNGKEVSPEVMKRHLPLIVYYKRDSAGRILASKVELKP